MIRNVVKSYIEHLQSFINIYGCQLRKITLCPSNAPMYHKHHQQKATNRDRIRSNITWNFHIALDWTMAWRDREDSNINCCCSGRVLFLLCLHARIRFTVMGVGRLLKCLIHGRGNVFFIVCPTHIAAITWISCNG